MNRIEGKLSVQSDQVLKGRLLSEVSPITFSTVREPILELRPNGDILVKGKLVETDKEVVDGMRELLGLDKKDKE
ncbi:hypothetical protein B7492_34145 (plasmid) [Bacillus mycoides]|uniref:Uncharacterized protein n=1 Tax=Bacillus mycoides TaxID=1405 RepID=A0A1W6AJS8_BACMY|nr:hypothetical protein [Bacillus mycoides]ARJ26074.1 hypothetical protein B7492_34145 [Bacillus mycoides]